jgi:hypothetical protein
LPSLILAPGRIALRLQLPQEVTERTIAVLKKVGEPHLARDVLDKPGGRLI